MVIGIFARFAAALALFVALGFAMAAGMLKTILLVITGIGLAVLLVAGIWMLHLHNTFSYEGKRKLSKTIVEGVASYVNIPDGGKCLDVGCGSGALPFADERFDIVLSLNGFHAFPDKEAAFRETCRVLKPGGTFCGCFYIAGENKRTDWLIDHIYTPKGFFTPPFETRESLQRRLQALYETVDLKTVESMACFVCRKYGIMPE